ncbi:diguanylate cyclase domain-containing protein [Thiomicrorhabdus indica]|uniref:sensor domain-containing diguanylate cyclase n=1 Tax=Thiomicrorhabdus indica TaxID=2267253 RepID=UPI002AA82343|nr:diguanylate cyclase [Thiomicrorhabdus indica]
MSDYFYLHRFKVLLALFLIATLQVITYFGVQYYQSVAQEHRYSEYSESVNSRVEQAIKEKQTTTIAMSIILSTILEQNNMNITALHDSAVINKVENFSSYKSVWVQVVDTQGKSLYRNWTSLRDGLNKIRPEFKQIIESQAPITGISSGRFDVSIKAVTPIFSKNQEIVGFLDLITHFNSIQRRFEAEKIDSLVIATQDRSKIIQHPFSSHKIGQHYVANLNPNPEILDKISPEDISQWLNRKYTIWNNLLVVPYPLVANNKQIHGYFFSFISVDDINLTASQSFEAEQTWKRLIQLDIFLSLLILAGLGFSLIFAQKNHYQDILNAENDLVLVTNGNKLSEGNQKLFEYFPKLPEDKSCVCDYFLEEEGYLSKYMGSKTWLEVLLENPKNVFLAKVQPVDKVLTLSVKATPLNPKSGQSVVVMSDISQLVELHDQSQTDPLTRAGNRRSFDFQLKNSIQNVLHNHNPLGFVIFDIDDFKLINDEYGHAAGDQVLKNITNLSFELLEHKRILYRVGGEEFVIILENTDKEKLKEICESIRDKVENCTFDPQITLSFGATLFVETDSTESLFKRADKALYQAKKQGKNQVVIL